MTDRSSSPDQPAAPTDAGALEPATPTVPRTDPSESPGLSERLEGAQSAVTDGLQTLARLLAGARFALGAILLALSLFGLLALVVGLATWHANVVQVIVVVLLVAPCIVAPQVLRRRIGDLAETAAHPAEAAAQAKDLLSRVGPGGELHREVDRLRGVLSDSGRGRTRRGLTVVRATGGVLGMVEPDPDRHRLLLPLRPERLARLSFWASGSLWGPLLAGAVLGASLATLVVRLVS